MTGEEKAEEYAKRECENRGWCDLFIEAESRRLKQAYLAGLAEGRKEKENIIGAMETLKNYCIEITKENGDCKKCVFCSKGYNGCKLQTSPNNWDVAE